MARVIACNIAHLVFSRTLLVGNNQHWFFLRLLRLNRLNEIRTFKWLPLREHKQSHYMPLSQCWCISNGKRQNEKKNIWSAREKKNRAILIIHNNVITKWLIARLFVSMWLIIQANKWLPHMFFSLYEYWIPYIDRRLSSFSFSFPNNRIEVQFSLSKCSKPGLI